MEDLGAKNARDLREAFGLPLVAVKPPKSKLKPAKWLAGFVLAWAIPWLLMHWTGYVR